MRRKINFILTIFISAYSICSINAQFEDYEYRASINQASKGWNAINLPLDIYGKTKKDLSDIRIYATSSTNEIPIEQPFILDIQASKPEIIKVNFKTINKTRTGNLNSFTFELSNKKAANKIHLNFSDQNFDWSVKLEGSMDQNTWFTIADNYRIISLRNINADFKYTDLIFPESKFNFYKISFNSSNHPVLINANLTKEKNSTSNYNLYSIHKSNVEEQTESKTTRIELDLGKKLPVGQVEILCNTTTDYYRPIIIEGVIDSFKTEKGWNYRYKSLFRGTINSFSDNLFTFSTNLVQKLRITVNNYDDQPLALSNFKIKGPNYRLISRFEKENDLLLVYGNKKASNPIYDLSFFKDKIPADINVVTVSQSEYFPHVEQEPSPLFKNKWWLWAIMIVVILLLGTFTIKMLREGK